MLRLRLPNDLLKLDELAQQLANFAVAERLSEATAHRLNLVVEELFVNFVKHGAAGDGQFDLSVDVGEQNLRVTLTDNGIAFNPLDVPAVDTDIPIQKRPVGGLGLHFVKQLCRQCDYERQDNRNIVRLLIPLLG